MIRYFADFHIYFLFSVYCRIWTSASKWGSSKFLWCPSGEALQSSVNYYAPNGGTNSGLYVLTAVFENPSGKKILVYADDVTSRPAIAVCEEK